VGLTVRYGTGHTELRAVDGVSLAIPAGQTLGLVGESGCGKSTLARAIVGLVPVAAGHVLLEGADTSPHNHNAAVFRRRVQMIFQDPYSSLNPRMSIGDTIHEALTTHSALSRSRRHSEAVRVLDLVGLPIGMLAKFPHELSGGQRQRVAIARALAVGPDLILLDEVTSALDVLIQATILNLLKRLQRELHLSYLFISHDLSIVRYMSDAIAVMYLGRIVETAPTDVLFQSPRHPYTQTLVAGIPQIGVKGPWPSAVGDMPDPRYPPAGCRFHTRCPVGPLFAPDRTVCQTVDPSTIAEHREHRAACHFAPIAIHQPTVIGRDARNQ